MTLRLSLGPPHRLVSPVPPRCLLPGPSGHRGAAAGPGVVPPTPCRGWEGHGAVAGSCCCRCSPHLGAKRRRALPHLCSGVASGAGGDAPCPPPPRSVTMQRRPLDAAPAEKPCGPPGPGAAAVPPGSRDRAGGPESSTQRVALPQGVIFGRRKQCPHPSEGQHKAEVCRNLGRCCVPAGASWRGWPGVRGAWQGCVSVCTSAGGPQPFPRPPSSGGSRGCGSVRPLRLSPPGPEGLGQGPGDAAPGPGRGYSCSSLCFLSSPRLPPRDDLSFTFFSPSL